MIDETEQAQAPTAQQPSDRGIADWAGILRRHIGSQPAVMDLEDIRSDGSFSYRFRGQRFTVTIRRTG